MTFAVIDLETTGLVPERGDRVVELAIVLTDKSGAIEDEWTTLVNPQRYVGATGIHGLTSADLLDAPDFGAIADDILRLVTGRTIVAHNASFDMRFLRSELNRAGYVTPDCPQALCSMKWAGILIGPAKLQHACEALGVPIHNAHSALGDARAAAGLLPHLICNGRHSHAAVWNTEVERSRQFVWPRVRGTPTVVPLRRGEQDVSNTWLDRVLEASWIPGVPENEASYLLALERVLLDRVISRTEARELIEIATSLSGATVARLHREYLCAVAREALSDGVVTTEERADLLNVASILGLTEEDVDAALLNTKVSPADAETFALASGDRVVFTGEMSRPREEVDHIDCQRGVDVWWRHQIDQSGCCRRS